MVLIIWVYFGVLIIGMCFRVLIIGVCYGILIIGGGGFPEGPLALRDASPREVGSSLVFVFELD